MGKPYPQWTKAEQDRLWFLTTQGDKAARDRMIEGNLPLVQMVAGRFYHLPGQKDDLVQAGAIGLIKAVDGFDPQKNCCFSTYAVPFILGEMRCFARTIANRKRDAKGLYLRVEQARADYMEKNFAEPTMKELADALGVAGDDLVCAVEGPRENVSEVRDCLAEGAFAQVEDKELLRSLLLRLLPRERDILQKRFFQNLSQQEIAAVYEISQAQVSRLERAALLKIRALIEEGRQD